MNPFVSSPPAQTGILAVIQTGDAQSPTQDRLAKVAAVDGRWEESWYWSWARNRASVRYPRFIVSFSGFHRRLRSDG
jgi:hypothetical protein